MNGEARLDINGFAVVTWEDTTCVYELKFFSFLVLIIALVFGLKP